MENARSVAGAAVAGRGLMSATAELREKEAPRHVCLARKIIIIIGEMN